MTIFAAYIVIVSILFLRVSKVLTKNRVEAEQYWKNGREVQGMPKAVMADGLFRLTSAVPYFIWCAIGLFGSLWIIFLFSIASQDIISKKIAPKYSIQVWLIQAIFYGVLYIALMDGWIVTPEIRILQPWH